MRVPRSRLPLVCLVLFALLAGQMLALVHGAVHGGGIARTAHVATHAEAGEATHAAPAPHGLAGLFENHSEGTTDCLLLDQVATSDLLPAVPAIASPPTVAAAMPRTSRASWAARWDLPFEARGPPAA